MTRYQYKARDGKGEVASGVVAAPTLEEASRLVRANGHFIIKLAPVAEGSVVDAPRSPAAAGGKVNRQDVIFFAHQLAVMIETGVPLSEAIDSVAEQAVNPAFRQVVGEVSAQVQGGGELSAALSKYPQAFPPIMVSLIRAGEMSGTLGTMFDRVSQYLQKEQRVLRQARGAMMYPLFMVCTAMSVTVFLLTFVLPRFAAIYASREATLPAPTRLLMAVSNSLVGHWGLWLAGTAGAVVGGYFFGRSAMGRRCLDWVKLNAPVVKNVYTHLYLTRACRTMGTMISAGVPMLDAVQIARQVTVNTYFQELWDQVDGALQQGLQLSDPLFRSPLIPRSVSQMIRSGEKSGRLSQVMSRIAEHTEAEFDQTVKTTTQFIEPVMVLVMGSVVGFIAISLLLPIFSISQVMSGK